MALVDDFGKTILPVDNYRRLMGIDPYHFWQMTRTGHPLQGYSHIYPHERWMYAEQAMPGRTTKRGPGRLDIIQSVSDAEEKIAGYTPLNTYPGPKYIDNEEVRLVKPSQVVLYNRTPYFMQVEWRHVQYVGEQTYTPLDTAVALTYGAGDDVTLSVTVVAGTPANEVVVCYEGTEVQIRPISVTVTGTTADITLKRWLCGKPEDWEDAATIDADDEVANLLGAVDVYRVRIDPSAQIVLAWEPEIRYCGCLGEDCAVCQAATRDACASRKNYKEGLIGWQLAEWSETELEYRASQYRFPYTRFPDLAYLSYLHGFATGGERYMSRKWAMAVAYLASALQADYVWDVTSQPEIVYHWRQDMSKPQEFGSFNVSPSDIDNPFGSMRGGIYAWKLVKEAVGS